MRTLRVLLLAQVRQSAVQYKRDGTWSLEYAMAGAATSAAERLEARITSEQKSLFKEAASLRGVTLTDFVVTSVHEAAVRTLEARHIIDLAHRDQHAFVEALLHPPAPNPELRRAWARHAPSQRPGRRTRRAKRPR